MSTYYRLGTRLFGLAGTLGLFVATQNFLVIESSVLDGLTACLIMGFISILICRFGISPRIKLHREHVDVEQIFFTWRIHRSNLVNVSYSVDGVTIASTESAGQVFAFSSSMIARMTGDRAAKKAVADIMEWRKNAAVSAGCGDQKLLWEFACQTAGIYAAYFATLCLLRFLWA